jgi:hypothetical protein
MTQEDPRQALGIGPEAGDEEIRAAYLRKVKESHPTVRPAILSGCETLMRCCATHGGAPAPCYSR